mmetsp:Transcript_65251/g.135112  ORF Transcript_65251/g.135112 Transcript_65251/m.135112 type:complete len:240 (+) Transcript_65251:45-764(+)
MAADQMKGLMNFAGKSPYGQDGLQPETWMQDEQSGQLNPFKVTTAWQDRSREDQLTMAQARLWETSKRSGKLKASMEGVVDTTTWLMKEVDKICPPIDLPPRHPGMSRAERHQRMLTLQRYLHSQPKECRLLRSEVRNATKLSVEAEQALYEATRRSGLAANAAMQAALSPALAFPPYHGPSFERPADTVSTEHVEEGEPEKGVPVCHLTCHHMGGRWTSDEVTWPWPKDEKATSFLLL